MYTHLTDEEAEDKKPVLPTVTQIVKDGTVVHSHFFFVVQSHSLSFLVISVTLCLDMLGWHGRNNIFYRSFLFVYSSKFQVYRIIVRL